MTKTLIWIAGVAGCIAMLTGCTEEQANSKHERDVRLDDGRTVHCLMWDRGISCDWAAARR